MSSKRSYVAYAGAPSANYKAARMVGGKVLRYNPSRPVAGSYRSRVSIGAAQRYGASKREMKGVDAAITNAAIDNLMSGTSGLQVVNLIAPGSGSFNRIGRRLHMSSVRITGQALFTFPTTANTSDVFRMILVYDQQPTGSVPNLNSIFGTTTQDGTETASTALSNLRYDNMERFKVIRDKCWEVITPGASAVSNTVCVYFDEFVSLKGAATTYSGQSATCTIADISTGALYLIFKCVNTAGIASISAAGQVRLRYLDA